MKRILVIDESEVVRETLALVLGRDFIVAKRSLGSGLLPFADAENDVDLLILGITPAIEAQTSSLLRFAAQAPFAVLFLVDSKSAAKAIEDREKVGCLAKPFNPYELKAKVGRLISRRGFLSAVPAPSPEERKEELTHYLEFPYLNRTAATLVHRFAATRLPILITGEIGCGQDRVARAIHALGGSFASRISINAAEIGLDDLAQKSHQLSWQRSAGGPAATLLVENLDRLPPAGQSKLFNFLEEEEAKIGRCRLLATSRTDLLEKVYQGEFLEALYYKLATLTLTLPPLRERRDDVPAIAGWFAQLHAKEFGLGEVSLSATANERLSNYLWFGNLGEMETVIARTLAVHRKSRIEASDLIFDFSAEAQEAGLPEFEEFVPPETRGKKEAPQIAKDPTLPRDGLSKAPVWGNGDAEAVELNVLIHELAHELKNPMVTIKTFAQLLGDRYQDENFRTRFRDVVGGDIERMDELLEVMIEFADFSEPRSSAVPLEEKLRSALDEISGECAKRQARIRWKGDGYNREIRADQAQLNYVLRNVLFTVLSEAKKGSEIEIDVEKQGCVAIAYLREAARVVSITHHFSASSSDAEKRVLPLRILLAKQLVERNGGGMIIDHSDPERDILKMEFPIA